MDPRAVFAGTPEVLGHTTRVLRRRFGFVQREDVDDVIHDVIERGLRRGHAPRPETYAGWMAVSAARHLQDRYKSAAHRMLYRFADSVDVLHERAEEVPAGGDRDDTRATTTLRDVLADAARGISQLQLECFELVVVRGLTHAAAGIALERSTASIKQNVFFCRQKLRRALLHDPRAGPVLRTMYRPAFFDAFLASGEA